MKHLTANAGLLLLAISSAGAQEKGAIRSFGDWVIGCDNVRYCRAAGLAPDEGPKAPGLVISREAAGGSPASVHLLWPDGLPAGAITLSSDGERLGTLRDDTELMEPQWEGEGHRIMAPEVEAKVLASLRKAKSISVAVEGGRDGPFTISLSGASAALLFMDERQKRIGTRTALARAGDKDPAGIAKPPALPPMPATPKLVKKAFDEEAPPAVRRLFASEAAKACSMSPSEIKQASVSLIGRLSDTQVLYGMECWKAAYNFGIAFYVFKEGAGGGTVSRAVFPDPVDRGKRERAGEAHVLSNADFSEETLDVSSHHKGRGIGDCGTSDLWRWTGARFEPVAAVSMPVCRGFAEETWFKLYRVNDPKTANTQ